MSRREHDHERGVVAPLYGNCGIIVNATSARVHPIGVTPGIADLICQAEAWGLTFYHETKLDGYRQTKEQESFMRSALICGTPYVLGDVSSANAFLHWLGIATPLNETIRFSPREAWPKIVEARKRDFDGDLALGWARDPAHLAAIERWGYREPVPRPRRPAARRA